MNPLVIEVAGAVARWLLSVVGAYLVAHHVLTADLADRLTAHILEHVLLAMPALLALGWAIVAKVRARAQTLVLNELMPGASPTTVSRLARLMSLRDVWRG